MDHPSDVSSTMLTNSIEKLFGISNLATTLSLQIREVATVIIGCIQEIDPTVTPISMAVDFDIMGQMTPKELMQIANIENTRGGLISTWRNLEAEKAKVIEAAKARIEQIEGGEK
ncbi:MAG: hypothetical protein AB1847_22840 [bacterium]